MREDAFMPIVQHQRNGVTVYACDSFPAWAAHGFSTKLGGVSTGHLQGLNLAAVRGDEPGNVSRNFQLFCAAVGADHTRLVKNHQIHSSDVRLVGPGDVNLDPSQPGLYPADGLVTNQKGVCLTIFSADCIPVLLCDPEKRVIAAAHAGWRGTASGIAKAAVDAMVQHFGCDPRNILAAIGPGIGPCCFETHRDVPDGLKSGLGDAAGHYITPLEDPEKFLVNLKGANRQWLLQAGLLNAHITISDACTACDLDTFWSHRKQGENRGSMAAVIQLLNE